MDDPFRRLDEGFPSAVSINPPPTDSTMTILEKYREKFNIFYKAIGPSRALNETSASRGSQILFNCRFMKAYLRLIRLRL